MAKTIVGAIDNLARAIDDNTEAEKELPAVTAEDEDKVLMVNSSGKWAAVSLSDLATKLAAL